MPGKDTQFTSMNYLVCHYCRHQAIGVIRQQYNRDGKVRYGCSLRETKEGHYRKIAPMPGCYDIDGTMGCDKFEPSGMPVHPSIIDTLVENNIKATTIPVGEKAPKTAEAFLREMLKYPHVECDFGLRKDFSKVFE